MSRLMVALNSAKGGKGTNRPNVKNIMAGFKTDTSVESNASGIVKVNTVLTWCDDNFGALIKDLTDKQLIDLFKEGNQIATEFNKKFMHMPDSVEELLLWNCFNYIRHYRTTGEVQYMYFCYVTDVHGSETDDEFEAGMTGKLFNCFMVADSERDIKITLSKDYHFSIQNVGVDRGTAYFKEVIK